jgi:hypothetical protein
LSAKHRASPSLVDHEDEPVELIWSGRHEGYGYFSPAAGWVTVENLRLALFGVSFDALIRHVLGPLDGMNETAIILEPDLLWEVGQVRLPGRGKRVSLACEQVFKLQRCSPSSGECLGRNASSTRGEGNHESRAS